MSKKAIQYSVCFAAFVREMGITWQGDERVRGLRLGEPVCGFSVHLCEHFSKLEFGHRSWWGRRLTSRPTGHRGFREVVYFCISDPVSPRDGRSWGQSRPRVSEREAESTSLCAHLPIPSPGPPAAGSLRLSWAGPQPRAPAALPACCPPQCFPT